MLFEWELKTTYVFNMCVISFLSHENVTKMCYNLDCEYYFPDIVIICLPILTLFEI